MQKYIFHSLMQFKSAFRDQLLLRLIIVQGFSFFSNMIDVFADHLSFFSCKL